MDFSSSCKLLCLPIPPPWRTKLLIGVVERRHFPKEVIVIVSFLKTYKIVSKLMLHLFEKPPPPQEGAAEEQRSRWVSKSYFKRTRLPNLSNNTLIQITPTDCWSPLSCFHSGNVVCESKHRLLLSWCCSAFNKSFSNLWLPPRQFRLKKVKLSV